MALRELGLRIIGKSIESVKLRELQAEEIRLTNLADRMRKGVDEVEKKSKKAFQEGVGADPLKKKLLLLDIKGYDTELKLKVKSYTTVSGELAFVKNMITLKKFEKELKQAGIWKKLTAMPRERVESWLIKLNLDQTSFEDVVNNLNSVFDMEVVKLESAEADEREKSVLDAWSQVESGSMRTEEAESVASSRRVLEKAEKEA
ncbi:MAG: chromosome assembly protein [Chloroflexi bacterium]|nr:chromosome assembly protein [Chloroflexota bacterium]